MKTYKECCKYDVHNDVERTVTILRPDGKKYIVDYPDNIGENHWVPDWIHPIEEKLTKLYYRRKKLEKIKNTHIGKKNKR